MNFLVTGAVAIMNPMELNRTHTVILVPDTHQSRTPHLLVIYFLTLRGYIQ